MQTRTVVSGALLADATSLFAHSVLNGAVWTDGAVVSQPTRQMPFKDNFIATNYPDRSPGRQTGIDDSSQSVVSLARPIFLPLKQLHGRAATECRHDRLKAHYDATDSSICPLGTMNRALAD